MNVRNILITCLVCTYAHVAFPMEAEGGLAQTLGSDQQTVIDTVVSKLKKGQHKKNKSLRKKIDSLKKNNDDLHKTVSEMSSNMGTLQHRVNFLEDVHKGVDVNAPDWDGKRSSYRPFYNPNTGRWVSDPADEK